MKIVIVSDSHGLTEELANIGERHAHEADLLIHCGDSELPSDHPALKYFVAVRGNCDYDRSFPEEVLKKAGYLQVLVAHGHLFSVKSSLLKLAYRGKEQGADVVCFGHSHQLGAEMIDDILFINPGSILMPRGRMEKTYVVLNAEGGQAVLHVYDVSGHEITALSRQFTLSDK